MQKRRRFESSLRQLELSEVHSCKKSEGKIVLITNNINGTTSCGYCNQIVNYKEWMMQQPEWKLMEDILHENKKKV